jgi:hypothetical protein
MSSTPMAIPTIRSGSQETLQTGLDDIGKSAGFDRRPAVDSASPSSSLRTLVDESESSSDSETALAPQIRVRLIKDRNWSTQSQLDEYAFPQRSRRLAQGVISPSDTSFPALVPLPTVKPCLLSRRKGNRDQSRTGLSPSKTVRFLLPGGTTVVSARHTPLLIRNIDQAGPPHIQSCSVTAHAVVHGPVSLLSISKLPSAQVSTLLTKPIVTLHTSAGR